MGAANAMHAYRRFAGRIPPTSLACLVYMALVALDADDWPWFGLGQAAVAEFALGRPEASASDLRAVQRAIAPLLECGALTVDRAGAARNDGNTTARYRLNIHDRADAARAAWEATPDGNRRMSDRRTRAGHTTVCDADTRRFVTTHTTVSDETPDGNRRPKEEDEKEERVQEEISGVRTAVTLSRAQDRDGDSTSDVEHADPPALRVVNGNPDATAGARPARPLIPAAMPRRGRWTTRSADTIAAAMAERAAARERAVAARTDDATAG